MSNFYSGTITIIVQLGTSSDQINVQQTQSIWNDIARLPFMQMRRLRYDFSYGFIGQVINAPVEVQEMVKFLPYQLNKNDFINVNIKLNIAYKSVKISATMFKSSQDVANCTVLIISFVRMSRLYSTVPFLNYLHDDLCSTA